MTTSPCGVLVIDKPAGPTSFEVSARVRRLLRCDKAGHTGTLDPLATGVLVVCLGEAVKLQHHLMGGDKTYEALVAFGASTTTQDREGEVTGRADPAGLDAERISSALRAFVGDIEQVPPMYSAVRVSGRRLHERARAGEEVAREPRKVRIDGLDLLGVGPLEGDLLGARLRVRCGKGTYVRALAADLGTSLGVPAHLGALRRTRAEPFGLEDAVPLDEAERLARAGPGELEARLLPMADALRAWPTAALSAGEARDLAHGRRLRAPSLSPGVCRALGPDGRLVAVCEVRAGELRPIRVFPASR